MILYNVTVSIDYSVEDEWLKWMKKVHIPDVMKTGLFIEYKLCRILAEEHGGASYSIQYFCKDQKTYDKYQLEHAEKLQAEHNAKYQGNFVAFRTLLEVIQTS